MGTHIDVLCGDYQNVIWRNHRAAEVDEAYEAYAGAQNFYTVYRLHNIHFEAYGAMFMGRKSQALTAATRLQEVLPRETVAYLPELFEAFWGMRIHVMVRFGMWQALLDETVPEDQALFCLHYRADPLRAHRRPGQPGAHRRGRARHLTNSVLRRTRSARIASCSTTKPATS